MSKQFNRMVLDYQNIETADAIPEADAMIETFRAIGYTLSTAVADIGVEPRGIMASGYAATDVFEGPHWDDEKELLGMRCRRIFIEFDKIQDPISEKIIPMDKLMEINPKYKWSSQTSGIEIPAHIAAEVERVWKNISR